MGVADNTNIVKTLARELGFDRVGVAKAQELRRADHLERWLKSGRAGEMEYLHRNGEIRRDPSRILDGARSVIVAAMNYRQDRPTVESDRDKGSTKEKGPVGRVAMYAWGRDYHKVVKKRLHALADRMREEIAEPFEARCCVDTAPLLERELAALTGVGWIGKNTLVMHESLGSYFFLGEIVTTLELVPDEPATDHCGTCTRCLDACPTGAFPGAYEMDATKCISYLTIEHRSEIDPSLQPLMGDWLFGCDICQDVCPFNRDKRLSNTFGLEPVGPELSLDEVGEWDEELRRKRLRGSAVKRADLAMLKRNAAIVQNNL